MTTPNIYTHDSYFASIEAYDPVLQQLEAEGVSEAEGLNRLDDIARFTAEAAQSVVEPAPELDEVLLLISALDADRLDLFCGTLPETVANIRAANLNNRPKSIA